MKGNGNSETYSSAPCRPTRPLKRGSDDGTTELERPSSSLTGDSKQGFRKAFVYKLKPSKGQLAQLETTLETCRHLYNACLAERKEAWEERRESISRFDQEKSHVTLRRKSCPYLSAVQFDVLSDVVNRLDKAFAAFFRRVKAGETPGHPRFKGRGWYDSFTNPRFGRKASPIKGRKVDCPGIGLITMFYSRPIEGRPKTATFIRRADGWYVSIVCEVEAQALPATGESVGLDLGIEAFATLSTGERIENPRNLKRHEAKLRRAARRRSRRSGPDKRSGKRPSRRWQKARALLDRAHQRVSNARKEFHRRTVSDLVKRFDSVAIEDLNIAGMMRNHHLAKHIADAGWGYFVAMLETKAESAGRTVTKVAPQYTSQDCSGCGKRVPKKLSQRWHSCPFCGLELHRDTNAARNIAAKATGGAQRLPAAS